MEVRAGGAVFVLPDAAWARRVSGVYANDLASAHPQRAHALLTRAPGGHYVVSVRAPLSNKSGADELCKRFETGGGRKAAAGINVLPEDRIPDFVAAFFDAWPA
jgi:single-stranded DNA-specific DHH superfamily exonuclease